MTNRKDLVIAILATLCLTTTIFMIIPTRSQNGLIYDPWEDINEDGVIDILDIVNLSNSYGATGDPTKNVNITNWPDWMVTEEKEPKTVLVCENYTINGTGGKIGLPFVVSVDGYRKYSVFYSYVYQPYGGESWYFYICAKALNISAPWSHGGSTPLEMVYYSDNWQNCSSVGHDVVSPELWFYVFSIDETSLALTIVVYCYN